MKFYIKSFFLSLSLFSILCTASERSAWEEVYEKALHKKDNTALNLLRNRYHALPPSSEKLYLASRLHGYFVLKGQPYYGEASSNQDLYSANEQRFLKALNDEQALNYFAAEETYLAFYSEMKQKADLNGMVLFEYHLCRLFQRNGRPYQARFYCSQMDQRIQNSEDPLFPRSRGLHLVANNLEFLGEYQEAIKTYNLLLNELPQYVDSSAIYNDIGLLMATLGQYESALEYLHKALDYRIQKDIPIEIAQVENSLGEAYFRQARYQESIQYFERAKRHLATVNYLYGLAYVHLGLGKAYIELNEFTEGDVHLLQALEYVSQHKDQHLQGLIYLALAQASLKQQQYQQATDYANQAISISESAALPRIKAQAYLKLAVIAENQQQYQQALNWYRQYTDSELLQRNTEQRKAFEALDLSKAELEQKYNVDLWQKKYRSLSEQYHYLEWQRIGLLLATTVLILTLLYVNFVQKRASRLAKQHNKQGWLTREQGLTYLKKIKSCQQDEHAHLVALIDIDQLSQFNARYGYERGDLAIESISQRLQPQLRSNDCVCRWGDDEFLIVIPNLHRANIETRLFALHHALNPNIATNLAIEFSVSLSYLTIENELANLSLFYPQLDTALQIAKQNGNGVLVNAADLTSAPLTA